MAALDEYESALGMRDSMDKLMVNTIDRERPKYRYATVVAIDHANATCTVMFAEGGDNCTVVLGAVQPTAVGQVVKIEGYSVDKHVTQVYGEAWVQPPSGLGAMSRTTYLFLVKGGIRQTSWPSNLIRNSTVFFGAYNLSANVVGAYQEEDVWLPRGQYLFYVYYYMSGTTGIFVTKIDGVSLSTIDTYGSAAGALSLASGPGAGGLYSVLDDGWHVVRTEITGKNASASFNYCGISAVACQWISALP